MGAEWVRRARCSGLLWSRRQPPYRTPPLPPPPSCPTSRGPALRGPPNNPEGVCADPRPPPVSGAPEYTSSWRQGPPPPEVPKALPAFLGSLHSYWVGWGRGVWGTGVEPTQIPAPRIWAGLWGRGRGLERGGGQKCSWPTSLLPITQAEQPCHHWAQIWCPSQEAALPGHCPHPPISHLHGAPPNRSAPAKALTLSEPQFPFLPNGQEKSGFWRQCAIGQGGPRPVRAPPGGRAL